MTAPESGRLRGDLLRNTDAIASLGHVATPEASHIEHAPTWGLEFGAYGTGYGNIRENGFEARNSNHSSNQDAFAVSADGKCFAVTDGLGGATDKEGTRFLSKFVADAAVQSDAELFFDAARLAALYERTESGLGRPFTRPRFKSKMVGAAATTLTRAEALRRNPDTGKTTMRLTIVGDSPAFKLNNMGEIIEQFGEDAQSGLTDSPLAYKLGVDIQGRPVVPHRGVASRGLYVVDQEIEVAPDELLVIGTDYFSDLAHARGRFGRLESFIGATPEKFSERVRGIGKPDDATLITIIPSRLPA
jgi:hypothetical protein